MSNVVVIHFEGTNSFRLDSPVILFLSLSFFLFLSVPFSNSLLLFNSPLKKWALVLAMGGPKEEEKEEEEENPK